MDVPGQLATTETMREALGEIEKSRKTRTYDQLTVDGLRFLCKERHIRVPRHTRNVLLRQLNIYDNQHGNQANTDRVPIPFDCLTMAALIQDCRDFGIEREHQNRSTLVQQLSQCFREAKLQFNSGELRNPNARRHF